MLRTVSLSNLIARPYNSPKSGWVQEDVDDKGEGRVSMARMDLDVSVLSGNKKNPVSLFCSPALMHMQIR